MDTISYQISTLRRRYCCVGGCNSVPSNSPPHPMTGIFPASQSGWHMASVACSVFSRDSPGGQGGMGMRTRGQSGFSIGSVWTPPGTQGPISV